MSATEDRILPLLKEAELLKSEDIATKLAVDHQAVVGAIKSLEGDEYIVSTMREVSGWKISAEGQDIVANGSPEFAVWNLLESPMDQPTVLEKLGKDKGTNGVKNGLATKIIKLEKADGKVILSRVAEKLTDTCQAALQSLSGGGASSTADGSSSTAGGSSSTAGHVDPNLDMKYVDTLKKRKLCSLEKTKAFDIKKGDRYAEKRRPKALTDLSKDMISNWEKSKEKEFKSYNMQTLGVEPTGGQLHPLLKVRQEFREIFLELGFQEMETQRFVDSSFWNFDTLFVPQKHPARDAQDTFFISKPEHAKKPEEKYLETVHKTHENGYQCAWSELESSRNVLRTHTTAVSAYVLYNLAQQSPICPETGKRQFKPGRYFSIDRVFRNEEMDKTHLCEFHQVEGFIVDRNLSLGNLMHTLDTFFRRVGIEKLRFKPAYNPYTEPSMEIFGYHSGMQRWMEVGNSGIFRPEMLKPMGFDDDVSVIAWGLSLERPTMIKYGIKDIHHLFGHKVDLKFIKRAMVARY